MKKAAARRDIVLHEAEDVETAALQADTILRNHERGIPLQRRVRGGHHVIIWKKKGHEVERDCQPVARRAHIPAEEVPAGAPRQQEARGDFRHAADKNRKRRHHIQKNQPGHPAGPAGAAPLQQDAQVQERKDYRDAAGDGIRQHILPYTRRLQHGLREHAHHEGGNREHVVEGKRARPPQKAPGGGGAGDYHIDIQRKEKHRVGIAEDKEGGHAGNLAD